MTMPLHLSDRRQLAGLRRPCAYSLPLGKWGLTNCLAHPSRLVVRLLWVGRTQVVQTLASLYGGGEEGDASLMPFASMAIEKVGDNNRMERPTGGNVQLMKSADPLVCSGDKPSRQDNSM